VSHPRKGRRAAISAQIFELAPGRRAVWRQGDVVRTADDIPAVVRRPLESSEGTLLLIDVIGGPHAGTSRLAPADSVSRAPAPLAKMLAPLARSMPEATCEIIRELRYCSNPMGGMRMGGQIGRAQEAALDMGWLLPDPQRPEWLVLSNTGRAYLVAARAMP
jgi:hypothetical protein